VGCAEQIEPVAVAILDTLRRLPPEERLEDIKVPVRAKGVNKAVEELLTPSFVTKRRVRHNLADLYNAKTEFRIAALRVGEVLAAQHDITPLLQSPGLVLESDLATAGVRFLGRLIDETIAGRQRFPAHPAVTIRRICERFEAQLDSRSVEVEWLYPLPFFGLVTSVKLSSEVTLRECDDASLEALYRSTLGGGISLHHPVLKTALVLVIRTRVRIPFVWSGTENTETVGKVVIALMLSQLPVPAPIIWWPEPCEPSLFEIQQSLWSIPTPNVFHRIALSADRIKTLKAIYKLVDSCPANVLNSVPVQRAVKAAYRGSYEDQLIDTWIALEALLLSKNETSELQYRMITRAARILRPPDLATFRKSFAASYKDRSRLVHGARSTFDNGSLKRLVGISVQLRQILLHAIRAKKLPDPARIDEEMLRQR
jgi:hypothetical protein